MSDTENDSPQPADLDVTEQSAIATQTEDMVTPPPPPMEIYGDVAEPTPEPHEALRVAQQVLLSGSIEVMDSPTNLSPYSGSYGPAHMVDPITQRNPLSVFEKFSGVTQHLRDDNSETNVDLYRVRKLNLAATVETLERAVSAHESFPNADAGIAVAKLAEQVNVLTKELDKSQNPMILYDKIVEETLEPLTSQIVKVIVEESRWLLQQFEPHVPEDKRHAFRDTVKQMAMRAGPSLKDSLDVSKYRLLVALNLQDKKPK